MIVYVKKYEKKTHNFMYTFKKVDVSMTSVTLRTKNPFFPHFHLLALYLPPDNFFL